MIPFRFPVVISHILTLLVTMGRFCPGAQNTALGCQGPILWHVATKHFLRVYREARHQSRSLCYRRGRSFFFNRGFTVVMLGYGTVRGWSHGVRTARTCHGYRNAVDQYDAFHCAKQAGQFTLEFIAASVGSLFAGFSTNIYRVWPPLLAIYRPW